MNGVEVYRCRNCGKRFRRYFENVSCCVDHGPKECCHAFEVEVTKKGWVKIMRAIGAPV